MCGLSDQAVQTYQALGHELRWRILASLRSSDRRVGELVGEVGQRQNLVSYHLGQLRRAGLVSERRSSADARDVYYTLNLQSLAELLDGATQALHPRLRVVADQSSDGVEGGPSRVLFVCTGNSARSLIAETLLRHRAGADIEVHSAGLRPAGVHPLTVRVLDSLGLPIGNLCSKSLEVVAGLDFDHVVTLCDIAREECPDQPVASVRSHWSLPDPAAADGPAGKRLRAFEATAADLDRRITYAIPVLGRRGASNAA